MREKDGGYWGIVAIIVALAIVACLLALFVSPARGEEAESAPTGRLAPLEDSKADSTADTTVAEESDEKESSSPGRQEMVGLGTGQTNIEDALKELKKLEGKIDSTLYDAVEYGIKEGFIVGRRTPTGGCNLALWDNTRRYELFLLFGRFAEAEREIDRALQESDRALAESRRLQSEINSLRDAEQGTSEEVRALQAKLGALTSALAGKGELDQFEGTLIERASQSLAENAELRKQSLVLQADVRQHPQWAEADKRLKAAEAAISEMSQVADLNIKRFNEALGRITEQEEIAAKLLEQRYHELLGAGGPTPEVVEETISPAAEILEDLEAHMLALEDLELWAEEIEEWRQTVVTKEELNRRLNELEQKIQQGRPEDAGGLAEWRDWRATIDQWQLAHEEAAIKAQEEDAAWKKAMEDWQKVVDAWRDDMNAWRQTTDQRLDVLEQRPVGGAPVTVVTMYTINFNDGVRVEETTGAMAAESREHDDGDKPAEEEPVIAE